MTGVGLTIGATAYHGVHLVKSTGAEQVYSTSAPAQPETSGLSQTLA